MRPRGIVLVATAVLASLIPVATASAVVGGKDTAAGAYPAVAYVRIGGAFACTGTLVAPSVVLTAGHCGSLTGPIVATPINWPPSMIGVTLGSDTPGGPGETVRVSAVRIPPSYLNTTGSDVSLLVLAAPAKATPVRIAGRGEEGLWAPGVSTKIVGYGQLGEDGPAAKHLQEADVPIVADATCREAYPGAFDAATQICAGFPQGGVDACQGDSGGPLFGHRPDGSLVVVGATSTGDGCARPGKYGIYARVADTALREWIRSVASDAVDADVTRAVTVPPAVPAGRCAIARKITVTVKRIYRSRVRSVDVLVGGKRVTTLRGGRTAARLVLTRKTPGKVTVRLVMRLKDGRVVTDTRRLTACK